MMRSDGWSRTSRRHDAELGRLKHEPLGLRASPLRARAAPIDPLHLIPHNATLVEIAVKHFADRRRSPAAPLAFRLRHALLSQAFRDADQAPPIGAELEDAADDLGLELRVKWRPSFAEGSTGGSGVVEEGHAAQRWDGFLEQLKQLA